MVQVGVVGRNRVGRGFGIGYFCVSVVVGVVVGVFLWQPGSACCGQLGGQQTTHRLVSLALCLS